MFFGLTIEKLLLIALVAALVIGPERLPRYAEALATFTKRARDWISSARTRVRDEMGDEFDDVDWKTLDPRQYDPRRIIREALLDDSPVVKPVSPNAMTKVVTPPLEAPTPSPFRAGAVPPYDSEAT
ncbi:twin-arginine translocase TatA/TatE family subunit [Microbacterium aoyamense]|uniref:Twin-arginine translocase TatA/TatE family subunit n=1 Tax=Microbacterium aoyamense TaxID=344166 RepID=A0ABN2PZV0_9MICO|nr:Sec-independent protein translocase TatB [Microbacterium aoyamense]